MSRHIKTAVMVGLTVVCLGIEAFGRTREIAATRAATPPVLDGELDDACWREAAPVEDFTIHGNKGRATFQSVACIAYDDANIYVAVKCLDPNPENIVAEAVPHDGDVFAGDVVEVMLASSPASGEYVHLAVNPVGSRYDAYTSAGGAASDPRWDGES